LFGERTVSVVIPTWNEAQGIAQTLRAVPRMVDEVVVVDANSSDGTGEIARSLGAKVVTELRRGYGRAFKTGFNAAKGDLLVSADGDGTYPLASLPELLAFLDETRAQFISCSRFPLDSERSMHARNRFGNQAMSAIASILFGHRFQDVLSGMWAMHRDAWVQLDPVSDSWNFSEEIKIRARRAFGDGFREFHIHYAERLGETKLQPWKVGVENLVWLSLMRAGVERQAKALLRPEPRRFPNGHAGGGK
jgi:glycosyltransferase involved in cell wall biosynthesis